jgi:hypothetical protein
MRISVDSARRTYFRIPGGPTESIHFAISRCIANKFGHCQNAVFVEPSAFPGQPNHAFGGEAPKEQPNNHILAQIS